MGSGQEDLLVDAGQKLKCCVLPWNRGLLSLYRGNGKGREMLDLGRSWEWLWVIASGSEESHAISIFGDQERGIDVCGSQRNGGEGSDAAREKRSGRAWGSCFVLDRVK